MEQIIDPDPYPAGERVTTRPTVWHLVKSYWHSNQRFPAYLFFSIITVLTVALVSLDVVVNWSYYYFYDVLYAYDKHGWLRLLLAFFMIASFSLVFAGYRLFVTQMCGERWKNWIMNKFVARLIQKRGTKVGESTQQDIISLVNYSIDLSMGLIGVITAFLAMLYVLYLMSESTTISLGSWGVWNVPGYQVWAGVIYALLGLFFIFKLRRPLVSANIENSRPVKVISKVSMGCYQLYVILPFVMVLPGSFEKVLAMSWLIQSLQAFNRVQGTLSFVVNSDMPTANALLAPSTSSN